MSTQPSLFQFLRMAVAQTGQQKLARTPEPHLISEGQDQVLQYDAVVDTKLVIAYALGLEVLFRCGSVNLGSAEKSALDLACGPGHFTTFLAKYLNFTSVQGRDLSSPMVATATKNAQNANLARLMSFQQGDIRHLNDVASGSLDLTTFTDAAHHMPTLEDVKKVLHEMDRVTHQDGFVFVMDLVRLRTQKLTEKYVNTLAADYVQQGLPEFLNDFRFSMFAAWTPSELGSAIPTDSRRIWYQVVPRFLPTVQFVVGLPIGRKKLFVRHGLPWAPNQNPVPQRMLKELGLARLSLTMASTARIFPR